MPKSHTFARSTSAPVLAGAGGHQDVVGLEIAVDDAEVVGHRHGREDLREQVDDARARQRPLLVDQRQQGAALDVLHGQVEEVAVLAEVEDAHRARVLETGGGHGLAAEALHGLGLGGELGVQDLQGHGAIERGLPSPPHGPHAALADERFDQELPGDEAATELRMNGAGHRDL
jgi:hypothetical protein